MTDTDIDFGAITFEEAEQTEKPERTRKPRSDKGQARGTRGPRSTSLKSIADELLVPWAMLATAVSFTLPTVAGVMLSRGEKTVDAFLSIAKDHPRMLAALKKASKMGPATELATTGVQITIAAALDIGKLPPDHPIAFNLGLTDLYAQTHPPMPNDASPNGFAPNFTPPPYPVGA